MTRCEQCEIWKKTINPTNQDKIGGGERHKPKPAKLVNIIKIKPGVEASVAEDAEVEQSAEIKTKPQVDVDMEEKTEAKQARCECQWLPWLTKCYGHCLKAAKKPEAVKLVDISMVKDVEEVNSKTKSAAQVFMEEEQEKLHTKKKMRAKLALLEKEAELQHELLLQSKTLLASKQALLHKKVRVTFNECHKLWRGSVVSAHKSFVDEQVDAAKARLGLEKHHHQFNISAMLDTIDKLAPGGCYKSSNPLPSSTSTSNKKTLTKKR